VRVYLLRVHVYRLSVSEQAARAPAVVVFGLCFFVSVSVHKLCYERKSE